MEKTNDSLSHEEKLKKEVPLLMAVLKEMKDGLDTVRSKVQALTTKVKADQFPTADGMSYLEAKHLLLLNYCQSLVYYLLCKAKGFSIEGHPVVRSLVEIRLFLEKIRSIDKKLQYQIQKLTRFDSGGVRKIELNDGETNTTEKTEELLKYCPNPDMIVNNQDKAHEDGTGIYRPPKFAPTAMKEDKMSKQERNALRKEKQTLHQAMGSAYMQDLMHGVEGRPEEIKEIVGAESRELTRYIAKEEERACREEELFTRAPLTKLEKKKAKHLQKSRNGLLGLTDGFYDEIRSLPIENEENQEFPNFGNSSSGGRKYKKRKRKY